MKHLDQKSSRGKSSGENCITPNLVHLLPQAKHGECTVDLPSPHPCPTTITAWRPQVSAVPSSLPGTPVGWQVDRLLRTLGQSWMKKRQEREGREKGVRHHKSMTMEQRTLHFRQVQVQPLRGRSFFSHVNGTHVYSRHGISKGEKKHNSFWRYNC